MSAKRGRPISTESNNPAVEQVRAFERVRKQRYRQQRQAQHTLSQNQIETIQESLLEAQDDTTTLPQLGLRIQGPTLPQDPKQISTIQQAVESKAIYQPQRTDVQPKQSLPVQTNSASPRYPLLSQQGNQATSTRSPVPSRQATVTQFFRTQPPHGPLYRQPMSPLRRTSRSTDFTEPIFNEGSTDLNFEEDLVERTEQEEIDIAIALSLQDQSVGLTQQNKEEEDLNREDTEEEDLNQQDLNQEDTEEEDLSQQDLNQEDTEGEDLNQQDLNQEDTEEEDLNQQDLNQEDTEEEDLDQQDLPQRQEDTEGEDLNQQDLNQGQEENAEDLNQGQGEDAEDLNQQDLNHEQEEDNEEVFISLVFLSRKFY